MVEFSRILGEIFYIFLLHRVAVIFLLLAITALLSLVVVLTSKRWPSLILAIIFFVISFFSLAVSVLTLIRCSIDACSLDGVVIYFSIPIFIVSAIFCFLLLKFFNR